MRAFHKPLHSEPPPSVAIKRFVVASLNPFTLILRLLDLSSELFCCRHVSLELSIKKEHSRLVFIYSKLHSQQNHGLTDRGPNFAT